MFLFAWQGSTWANTKWRVQPNNRKFSCMRTKSSKTPSLCVCANTAAPAIPSITAKLRDSSRYLGGRTSFAQSCGGAEATRKGVLDSIHFYEKLNGAFPFDHLDVAQIPGSFGQGWPGLVYLSTLAFLPAEDRSAQD